MNRVQKRLRTLQQQQRRQEKLETNFGLTDRMVKIIVVVYVFSQYSLPETREVAWQLYQKRMGSKACANPTDFPIRDWFIKVTDQTPGLFFESDTKADCLIRKEATKLLAEVKAAMWVRDENFGKGRVAPAEEVIQEFRKQAAKLGDDTVGAAVHASSMYSNRELRRTARRWCQKFRRRWGITRGALPCLDAPPKPILKEKAGGSGPSGLSVETRNCDHHVWDWLELFLKTKSWSFHEELPIHSTVCHVLVMRWNGCLAL